MPERTKVTGETTMTRMIEDDQGDWDGWYYQDDQGDQDDLGWYNYYGVG